MDIVKLDVVGFGNKDVNPMTQFNEIFESSILKYKTEPIIVGKDSFTKLLVYKKLNGYIVIKDDLSSTTKEIKETKIETIETFSNIPIKTHCVSKLSILIDISQADIMNLMQSKGFINVSVITKLGQSKGIVMKNYMGKDYISYPENLEVLSELQRQK